jgi:hypothetical protein
MSKRHISKAAIAALSFALGLTLAGGVAAVAASKPAAVKACVDSHHFLATASKHKCPRGTRALTLGVKGPRGARGAKGVPGTPGANGLSQVLVGDYVVSTPAGALDDDYINAFSISTAPIGNYLITYSLVVHDTASTGSALLECFVGTGTPISSELKDVSLHPNDFGTLTASGVVTLPQAGPIDVQCHGAGVGLSALDGNMFATKVNTLTPS